MSARSLPSPELLEAITATLQTAEYPCSSIARGVPIGPGSLRIYRILIRGDAKGMPSQS